MTTTNEVAVTQTKAMLRPLKVLVPLIKQDISEGDKAAERAGMPYYRAAGEKLLEAKEQVPHGEWLKWLEQNFEQSRNRAALYMRLATKWVAGDPPPAATISQFHAPNRTPCHEAKWVGATRNVLAGISHDQFVAQMENKREEKKLRQQMALELIDAGFKMMAIKLHPDKGGSDEAMRRLTEVHKELREIIEQQIKADKKLQRIVRGAQKN